MKTEIGKQYCVTCDSACDIVDTATGNTIHTHHAGEAQSYFTAIGLEVEASDDTAVVTEVFKSAPAGNGGGGYIESDLNVGHGAADAVAAVCTLTLGDLSQGGTLEDSNGRRVELEDPHRYAEGYLAFRDATEACSLAIGEWSKAWEAAPVARATGWLQLAAGAGTFMVNGVIVNSPGDYTDVEAWNDALEPCGVFCTDESIESGSPKINIAAIEYGEAGNAITLEAVDEYAPVSGPTLTGGANARTKQDVVDAIASDADCPVNATLDADEAAISLTAKEYGSNDTISVDGDMFASWSGMSGGHGDYTVAELVTAIGGGFDDVAPTAGEAEGTIVLTANETGAAANSIVYTATGCFGGGTVKQGSTTRGKNAVAQTDFEVILNGNQPRPLVGGEHATAMKNGRVYTVAADGTARDFSAVTLGDNATAEVWLECTAATNITWPTAWMWLDGSAPQVACNTATEASHRYRITVRNEGPALNTVVRVAYDYSNPKPAQS